MTLPLASAERRTTLFSARREHQSRVVRPIQPSAPAPQHEPRQAFRQCQYDRLVTLIAADTLQIKLPVVHPELGQVEPVEQCHPGALAICCSTVS